MLYVYECHDCRERLEAQWGREAAIADYQGPAAEGFLFQTSHAINPSASELHQARQCPRCEGTNTDKSWHGSGAPVVYVRGNGYLDRAGCQRDMHLHHLTGTDDTGQPLDPYAEHRVAGEVDELKSQLQRAGQHAPRPQHYVVPRAVSEQAASGTP